MTSGPGRRIAIVEGGHRFWVFPQIHGALEPFKAALDLCKSYYQTGDRLIFLGSQIGIGGESQDVIEELMNLEDWTRSASGEEQNRSVFWLRGVQEELIERLYTLYMATEPLEVLEWMISEHNFDQLLPQFGVDSQELRALSIQGASALAGFTGSLRESIHASKSMSTYFNGCARAAVTDQGQLLFVHAGVDPAKTLSLQTDAFWWGHPGFFRLKKSYQGFLNVVSTVVPDNQSRVEGMGRLAFDAGCGRAGHLTVLCLDPRGQELFSYDF